LEKLQELDVSHADDANLISSFGRASWIFPKNTFFHTSTSQSPCYLELTRAINQHYFSQRKHFDIPVEKKREIEINPVHPFDDNRIFISGCIMPDSLSHSHQNGVCLRAFYKLLRGRKETLFSKCIK